MKKTDFKEVDFLCGSIWNLDGDGKELASTETIYKSLLYLYPSAKVFCILHDKDVDEDGNPKPLHTHFVICVNDQPKCFILKLAQQLEVPPDAISVRVGENYKGAIRYLLHRDDEDKYQYNALSDKTILKDYKSYKNFFTNSFKEFYEICKYLHYSIENLKYAETQRDFLELFGSDILSNREVKTAVSFWYSSPALQKEIQLLKDAKSSLERDYYETIKHFDEMSKISLTDEKEALRLLRAWFGRIG